MAFVDNINEEDKDQKQEQGGGSEVIVSGSGSGTVNQGASSSGPQTGQGDKTASSSGWSNLQSYITANKGNDANLASGIKSKVQSEASALENTAGSLDTKATQDVAKNTVRDSGVIQGLQTTPTKVNKADYYNQRDAVYGGPQDLTGYEEYNQGTQQLGKLNESLKNTQTDSGRRALLGETFERPDYNTGMKNLDSFILGASEGSQQEIKNLNEDYGTAGTDWQNLKNTLQGRITEGQNVTSDTRTQTAKAFQDALANSQNIVNEAKYSAQDANKAATTMTQSIVKRMASPDPRERAAAFKQAGVDPKVGEFLISRGVAPNAIINQGQTVGIGNFLNEGDAANYEALMELENKAVNDDLKARANALNEFILNQKNLSAALEAMNIQDSLTNQLGTVNQQRTSSFNSLRDKLASGNFDQEVANALGVSAEDLRVARSAGVDLVSLLNQGNQLNTGDLANDDQRARYAALQSILGLNDNFQVQDTQDEGNPYSFNADPVRTAVARVREQETRQEEERNRRINSFGDRLTADERSRATEKMTSFGPGGDLYTQSLDSMIAVKLENIPNIYQRIFGQEAYKEIVSGKSSKTREQFLEQLLNMK